MLWKLPGCFGVFLQNLAQKLKKKKNFVQRLSEEIIWSKLGP